MRDDYAGDITDFVKFGLLRTLFGGTAGRLGMAWFLCRDHETTNDGNKTGYLKRDGDRAALRSLDADLYDKLARMVAGGRRSVAQLQVDGILPRGTHFHDTPLSLIHLPKGHVAARAARLDHRAAWLAGALTALQGATFVFFAPDNGMEVGTPKHHDRGAKYVYFDELRRFTDRGQSFGVIQFAQRHKGTVAAQTAWRVGQLRAQLGHTAEIYVLYSGLGGARSFFLVPADAHRAFLRDGVQRLQHSAWRQHIRISTY